MNAAPIPILVTVAFALVGFAPLVANGEPTPAFWDKAPPPDTTVDPADPFAAPSDPFATPHPVQHRDHEKPQLDPGPAGPLRIRQITFRVPIDKAHAINPNERRADDAALFSTFDGLAQDGEIDITADFDFHAIGGRMATQEARQEFMYPTEIEPDGDLAIVSPSLFQTRNLGSACSLTPRLRHDEVRVDGRVSRVRWRGFSSWLASRTTPVGDQPRSCLVRQPVILTETINYTSLLSHGSVQLIGVQPESSVPGSAEEVVAWLYTFLRVAPAMPAGSSAASAPVAEGDGMALELVIIRATRDEAARWIAERELDEDDATDLAAWEKRTTNGAGAGSSRWALRAVTGPLRPGGPPRTSVESIGEFIYPTEFDPGLGRGNFFSPTAFETRNCGSGFSAQATWAADGASALVALSFEDITLEEIESWPVRLGEPLFQIEQPLFRTRTLVTEVGVPLNGVRFVGLREGRPASGDSGADEARDCELLFLKVRGTPRVVASEARPAPPVLEAQAMVFSVSATMAAELALESDEGRRIAVLRIGHPDGEVRIVHLTVGAACIGGALKNSDLLESIYPTEFNSKRMAEGFLPPTAFETFNHGKELNLRPRLVGGGAEARIGVQWESAPASRPSEEEYRRFCESHQGDVPKPRFFQEKAIADGAAVPLDERWHILSFQECGAPEGAPEHGRWHATVARVLQRRE